MAFNEQSGAQSANANSRLAPRHSDTTYFTPDPNREEPEPEPEPEPVGELPPPSRHRNVPVRAAANRQPTAIRIRRLRSSNPVRENANENGSNNGDSNVQPHYRSMLDIGDEAARPRTALSPIPQNTQTTDFESSQPQPGPPLVADTKQPGRFRRLTTAPFRPRARQGHEAGHDSQAGTEDEYNQDFVNMLDAIDPEVSTLSSITNIQNSLFVPSLGRWVNRRPTYNITRDSQMPGAFPPSQETVGSQRRADENPPAGDQTTPIRPPMERALPSDVTDSFYAVRPDNVSMQGWSDEDVAELNDHVRHMLHSRRSKFRRTMKAFGQYVRKPLGFLVTLYATLITLFGLAWVLFLIGWINVGGKQLYVINVIDNVLVALFAIVGDGFIPWRLVDTYHMCFIARYYHLTWKLRKKMALPGLKNKNDLPAEPTTGENQDLEAARDVHVKKERSVLTPQQQAKLEHHQNKFAESHTFYKPHETDTHFAFPLRLLVAIVVLLDCHSCFQLALGLCTWLIDYHVRPGALTAVILCCSIAVNCTAGILISIGDRRTRKKDVMERMFRQELTEEAMKRIERHKEKEREEQEKEKERQEKANDPNHEEPWEKWEKKLSLKRKSGASSRRSLDRPHNPVDQARKSIDQVGRFDPASPFPYPRSLFDRCHSYLEA